MTSLPGIVTSFPGWVIFWWDMETRFGGHVIFLPDLSLSQKMTSNSTCFFSWWSSRKKDPKTPFAGCGRGKKCSGFLSSFLRKKKCVFTPPKGGIFSKKWARFLVDQKMTEGNDDVARMKILKSAYRHCRNGFCRWSWSMCCFDDSLSHVFDVNTTNYLCIIYVYSRLFYITCT